MKEKQSHSDHSQEKLNDLFQLILYNDDHNSFEHVIRAMVEVCGHDSVQAEQCAVIAHFTGRCDIRRGDRSVLDRMGSDLRARGLKVEIIK
jgi:ATP-dependent Clp protease adaptor protein ClpS